MLHFHRIKVQNQFSLGLWFKIPKFIKYFSFFFSVLSVSVESFQRQYSFRTWRLCFFLFGRNVFPLPGPKNCICSEPPMSSLFYRFPGVIMKNKIITTLAPHPQHWRNKAILAPKRVTSDKIIFSQSFVLPRLSQELMIVLKGHGCLGWGLPGIPGSLCPFSDT